MEVMMSQDLSNGGPTQSPSTTRPNDTRDGPAQRTVSAGIVALLAIGLLCAGAALFLVFGPIFRDRIVMDLAQQGCQTANSDLTAEECYHWAASLDSQYAREAAQCGPVTIFFRANNPESAAEVYQCLLDEGVAPPR